MPAVRVEDEAFSDIRYDVLASACQLADADHARGKMLNLWRQCTAQHRHVLPRSMIVAVLGLNGPVGIVEAGLGEEHPEGIRIRGTEGRIEWLAKLRDNASKGGAAKAAKRLPIGSPEGSPLATQTPANTPAKALPPPCPPTPTLTTTLKLVPSEPAPEAGTKSRRAPEHTLPADWSTDAAHASLAQERGVDLRLEVERFRAHAEANDRRARNWAAAFRQWLLKAQPDRRGAVQTEIRTNYQPL